MEEIMTSRFSLFAKAMLLGFAAWAAGVGVDGSVARADFITFDPDGANNPNGTGSLAPIPNVTGFDYSVGNFLGQGLVTARNAWTPTNPTTFQVYYQAALAGLINTTGTFAPTGLNSTYEITAVASFTAVVTNVSGNSLTFAVAPAASQTNSFLRFFYDQNTATFANNLNGTGFNDGTQILTSNPFASPTSTGNFTSSTQPPPALFDAFAPDNYSGKQSVAGNGSDVFTANNVNTNAAFFVSPALSSVSYNTSLVLPFSGTNPSGLFTGLGPGGITITPSLGNTNGVSGPDYQFQADANIFPNTVPEPASMTLLGMGLAGAFGYGWRKRQRTA